MAYNVDVEGWQIRYFPESAPTGCIMGGTFRDGTRLSVIVTAKYEWALALSNASWNLKKDGTTDVAINVDQKFVASGKATHYDRTIALLPLTGAAPFRALQTGHRLDLQTPYGNLNFQLAGSGKAMYAVLDCVKTLNPAKPSPPRATTAQQEDFQMLPQAEAAVMLTNLFNAAGIRDYRLDPPKPGNNAIGYNLSDGTAGFFLAARGLGTKNADDYAGIVIGKLSGICKGEFLSGKQSVPSVDGSVVRKVLTTCRTGDNTLAMETTIIRRTSGFLMELTQVVPATTATMGGGDNDRSALINAAMRMGDAR
jgi:hypothetical protein